MEMYQLVMRETFFRFMRIVFNYFCGVFMRNIPCFTS